LFAISRELARYKSARGGRPINKLLKESDCRLWLSVSWCGDQSRIYLVFQLAGQLQLGYILFETMQSINCTLAVSDAIAIACRSGDISKPFTCQKMCTEKWKL